MLRAVSPAHKSVARTFLAAVRLVRAAPVVIVI
jgi:hypothetical protein